MKAIAPQAFSDDKTDRSDAPGFGSGLCSCLCEGEGEVDDGELGERKSDRHRCCGR